MKRWVIALVTLCGLSDCVFPNTAAQRGDAAAARGDWKDAERAYRAAVDREPANAALAQKYQEARIQAVAVAMRTAEACRERADLACVDRELQYVLSLDPGNVDAARMQGVARTELARAELAEAQRLVDAGRPEDALVHVDQARAHSADPEISSEASDIEARAAALAAERARELLASADGRPLDEALRVLDDALALAHAAMQRDSSYAAVEREIAAQRVEIARKEAERLGADADAALSSSDFARAGELYEQAARISSDVRLSRRAEYARSIAAGDRAVAQRDFEAATRAFQKAVATGEDTKAIASARAEAAEPRVYRIQFDWLMITPSRPGTDTPWVGDSWIRQVAFQGGGAVAGFMVGGPAGAKVGQELGKVAANVPPENRPTLRVLLELPDGRVVAAEKKKGIYVTLGAELWLTSNHYDTRTLRVFVQHVRTAGNEDVGTFRIPLGELVSQQVLTDIHNVAPAIQAVSFYSEPADEYLDGGVRNLLPVDQDENKAPTRSSPKKGRLRYQLTDMRTIVSSADNGGDFGSEPDPEVSILQDSDEVFRSTIAKDTRTGTWALSSTYLFAAPDDKFTVFVRDVDPLETDDVFSGTFTGAQITSGTVTLKTQGGSSLTMSFTHEVGGPR